MKIFLISGKSESGKDSFYKIARQYFSQDNVYRLAFADEVKRIATEMGWNGEKDENGRSGLIMVGEGARKYFDEDIWIKKLLGLLQGYHTLDIIFITDCRYPNEVDSVRSWAKSHGHEVYTVRVERPLHVNKLTEEQRNNPSEVALDDYGMWDYIIDNGGDYDMFIDSVNSVMKDIFQ